MVGYLFRVALVVIVACLAASSHAQGIVIPDDGSWMIKVYPAEPMTHTRETDSIRKEIETLRSKLDSLTGKLNDIARSDIDRKDLHRFLDSVTKPPYPQSLAPFNGEILPKDFMQNPGFIPKGRILVPHQLPSKPQPSTPNPNFPGWRIQLLHDIASNYVADGVVSTPQPIVTNRLEFPDNLVGLLGPSFDGNLYTISPK